MYLQSLGTAARPGPRPRCTIGYVREAVYIPRQERLQILHLEHLTHRPGVLGPSRSNIERRPPAQADELLGRARVLAPVTLAAYARGAQVTGYLRGVLGDGVCAGADEWAR